MEINAIKTNRSFSKVYWIFHTSWWLFIICVELLRHVEAIFTHVSIEIFIYYFDGSLAGLTLHLIFTKIKYKSFSRRRLG